MSMNETIKELLKNRYVLFSCEGAAEGVIVQKLYDNNLTIIPQERFVQDYMHPAHRYTRCRKAEDIVRNYFGFDYAVDGAEGLLIARVVDSATPKFEIPRRQQNGTQVLSFITRPEIEMLVIHKENKLAEWYRALRKANNLKPSEFCKQNLGLAKIKEINFLKKYWSDGYELVSCIQAYAATCQRKAGELMLVDILK
jgi:hypothetical protein